MEHMALSPKDCSCEKIQGQMIVSRVSSSPSMDFIAFRSSFAACSGVLSLAILAERIRNADANCADDGLSLKKLTRPTLDNKCLLTAIAGTRG